MKIKAKCRLYDTDFIIIDKNDNILLFDYCSNIKIKMTLNNELFLNTEIDSDIDVINDVLKKYNMIALESKHEDNIYCYDILYTSDYATTNKDVKRIKKEEILKTLDYDFMFRDINNGSFNVLKYNNHKRVKKQVANIIDKATSIAFANLLLHKYNLKCYLVSEYDNVRYYEIISDSEYNRRTKEKNKEINKEINKEDNTKTSVLDLSDLD